MNIFKWMCMIFIGLFVLIVIVQNYESFSTSVTFRIDLKFFKWQSPPLTLYFVSCITFIIGVILTGFYGIFERFRLKNQIRQLKKELDQKEKELVSLRNLPVTSDEEDSAKQPINTG